MPLLNARLVLLFGSPASKPIAFALLGFFKYWDCGVATELERKDIIHLCLLSVELTLGAGALPHLFLHSAIPMVVPDAEQLGRSYDLQFVLSPSEPRAGETTLLSATLILSTLRVPQVHVDWLFEILFDTESLFPLGGHSNTGQFVVSFIFPRAGTYRVRVAIPVILFAPIMPLETDRSVSVKPPGGSGPNRATFIVQAVAAVLISAAAVALGMIKVRRPSRPLARPRIRSENEPMNSRLGRQR